MKERLSQPLFKPTPIDRVISPGDARMKAHFATTGVASIFGEESAGSTGFGRRRRKYLSLVPAGIVALALLLSDHGHSRADIVYTNFGPGQSYGTSYWGVGNFGTFDPSQVDAFQFTPSANYTFAAAMIAVSVA